MSHIAPPPDTDTTGGVGARVENPPEPVQKPLNHGYIACFLAEAVLMY